MFDFQAMFVCVIIPVTFFLTLHSEEFIGEQKTDALFIIYDALFI